MSKKPITVDDCIKWKLDKSINPHTGSKLSAMEKSPIYKRLEKSCKTIKTPIKSLELEIPIKGQKKPITAELCYKWLKSGKTKNPLSNYPLNKSSSLYKSIERACIKLKIIDAKTKEPIKPLINEEKKEEIIIKKTKNPKHHIKEKITDKDCIEWKKNKLRNPKTKTKTPIKKNGPIYNEFKEACKDFKTPIINKNRRIKSISIDIKIKDYDQNNIKNEDDDEDEKEREEKKFFIKKNIRQEPELSDTYYPDLNDPEFNKKLLSLKEIAVHKINNYPDIKTTEDFENKAKELCESFDKSSFQYLMAHYLSYRTPYRSLLLYYSVGVGKTCTAITIAESLLINHNTFDEPKIWVILPGSIEGGFKNQIFNTINMLDFSNITSQCTGDTYVKLAQLSNEIDMKTAEKRIRKLIKSRYLFFTYEGFANFIDNNYIKKGKIAKDKVIIVDEAHNIRSSGKDDDENKRVYNSLTDICKSGINNRLILLTATPMYNEPTDIYNLFKLLLINDKRENIYKGNLKIFDNSNNLKKEARDFISLMASNYISYLRGKNPFNFAFKLSPKLSDIPILDKVIPYKEDGKPIDNNDKNWLNNIEDGIVISKLSKKQIEYIKTKKNIYDTREDIEEKGMNSGFSGFQYMNIVYDNMTGKSGFNNFFIREGTKEQLIVKYTSKYKNALAPDENHMGLYSGKFLNISNIIKKSKGVIIIYSTFIWDGVLPLAIMLEHMGFTREGTDNLLSEPAITEKISYEGIKNPKYCILSSTNPEIMGNTTIDNLIEKINNPLNLNGELVKVILITPVAGEGLNIYNVREMHITNPWYHFNKIDQIIGRGIRNCSHKKLPLSERNVTVYLHSSIEDLNRETPDINAYRIATRKLSQSFIIDEIIRNNAIDCSLFKSINYFPKSMFKLEELEINTSQGKKIKYKLGDNEKFKPICKVNVNEIKQNSLGFREETYKHLAISVQLKIKKIILNYIQNNKRFLSFEELKKIFNYIDPKILMHSIKISIYPNIIIDNIILLPHENGIHIIDIIEDNPLKISLIREETEEEITKDVRIDTKFYDIINETKDNYYNAIISLYQSIDELTFKLLINKIFKSQSLNTIDRFIEDCFVKEGVLIKSNEIPLIGSSDKYIGFVNIFNEEFQPLIYDKDENHKSLNQKQMQQLKLNRIYIEKPIDFSKETKPWGMMVPIYQDKTKKNKINVFKLFTIGISSGIKKGIVCTSLKKPNHIEIFKQLNIKEDNIKKTSYCNKIAIELMKIKRMTLIPEYKPK